MMVFLNRSIYRFNSKREFESVETNSQLLSDIKNLPGQYFAEFRWEHYKYNNYKYLFSALFIIVFD
ncbi:hypothetical protein LguiA_007082 [Lonicera macranthoides]